MSLIGPDGQPLATRLARRIVDVPPGQFPRFRVVDGDRQLLAIGDSEALRLPPDEYIVVTTAAWADLLRKSLQLPVIPDGRLSRQARRAAARRAAR